MDYSKLQINVLKAANAYATKHKNNPYMFMETTMDNMDYIGITEGHFVVLIPKSLYFLDSEKVFDRAPLNLKVFEDIPTEICTDTGINKDVNENGKKLTLHILELNGEKIYLDAKLLKEFNATFASNLTFKGTNSKSPVYIYDGEMLLGCLLPVYHRE